MGRGEVEVGDERGIQRVKQTRADICVDAGGELKAIDIQ